MKIIRHILIGIILLAFVTGIGVVVFMSRGESLYDCEFQLSADKQSYKVDDVIVLTARIIPKSARFLTLSEDLWRNLSIWHVESRRNGLFSDGKPVRHHLTPAKPLQFQIAGKCIKFEDGTVWFDFGDYGRALVTDGRSPPLRFMVFPHRVPLMDSVEWGPSNELELRFER